MFVVADQGPRRVSRERRLPGAGKAEEHGGIVRVIVGVVGGAMHRHHTLFGQEVVQKGEDRLLVFAGILGVGDQDQLLFEVERDHGIRPAAVPFRVGGEAWAVDDREFRHEAVKLGPLGPPEKVADEQVMPGELTDHTHIETMLGVGAAVKILHEVFAALHVLQHVLMQAVEGVRCHRGIVVPPDLVFDRRGADDELVFRGPSRELAGRHQEGAPLSHATFTAAQCGLDQRRFKKVVVNGPKSGDPEFL
jgi:hypothetical protein